MTTIASILPTQAQLRVLALYERQQLPDVLGLTIIDLLDGLRDSDRLPELWKIAHYWLAIVLCSRDDIDLHTRAHIFECTSTACLQMENNR